MDKLDDLWREIPVCDVCGAVHEPQHPHKLTDVYRAWFRDRFGRLPTRRDAMAHCSTMTRAVVAAEFIKDGIRLENTGSEENNGWIPMSQSPIVSGIDQETPVLVWHAFQGVIVDLYVCCHDNRFYTHWQTIDHGAWIRKADKLPGHDDADMYSCVIARQDDGGVAIVGYDRVAKEREITHWQTPPEPPDNYLSLKKDRY